MPTNCSVPFCPSDTRKKVTGITFHEFPCDEEVRDKWIRAVRRKDPVTNGFWTPKDRSLICSLHFAASCFSRPTTTAGRTKLIKGSVPTIFPLYSQPEAEKSKVQKPMKRMQQKPPKEKQRKSTKVKQRKSTKEKQRKPLKEKQQNIKSKQKKPTDFQQHNKWSSLVEVACAYELASEIEALAREHTPEVSSIVPSVKASSIIPKVEVPDEDTLEAFTIEHETVTSNFESTADASVIDELDSEFDLNSTLAIILIKNR